MGNNLITVVIPARNEERTITKVIELVKLNKKVNQIIVVDNNSTDNTAKLAKTEGVEVIECKEQGKGYAMENGIKCAKNNIIVFIDADVNFENTNIVSDLTKPIIEGKADFVKSTFDRKAGGVVTEVVVKPLLDLLYPDMYKFSEPISGMIATKKDVFDEIELEKNYGVDVGILIDIIEKKYRVSEVNIGKIENMSHINKNNDTMSKMSKEIIEAILKRKIKNLN